MPAATFATPSRGISGNQLDQITMMAESRGQRYGQGGGLLRSPVGAMGEMQVMPATARDPGFGIRPWDGSSHDDLARVGRDYRRAMQQRYGGDPAKMWGAYNAGPGRVDGLIERYGDRWLDYAPLETRKYVAQTLGAMRGR